MEENLLFFGGMILAAIAVATGAGGSGGKSKSKSPVTPFNQARSNPLIGGNQFSFKPSSRRSPKKSPSSSRSA